MHSTSILLLLLIWEKRRERDGILCTVTSLSSCLLLLTKFIQFHFLNSPVFLLRYISFRLQPLFKLWGYELAYWPFTGHELGRGESKENNPICKQFFWSYLCVNFIYVIQWSVSQVLRIFFWCVCFGLLLLTVMVLINGCEIGLCAVTL